MTIFRAIKRAMLKVPNSNHVTEVVCDKFSGYLQVDAKYVSVRGKKMAFIWAIDYYTHDIVWNILVPSENTEAYLSLFKRLRSANYHLKALICDDHPAIIPTALSIFRKAKVQICTTHYKRNIRKKLDLRNNTRDKEFWNSIKLLFAAKNFKHWGYLGRGMIDEYGGETKYIGILGDIQRKSYYLTTYITHTKCPSTTNLIEGYNKHLSTRLRKIDGFKTYPSAELWLNAYVWMRRTTPLQCCKGKFKNLNRHTTLSLTARDDLEKIYNFY